MVSFAAVVGGAGDGLDGLLGGLVDHRRPRAPPGSRERPRPGFAAPRTSLRRDAELADVEVLVGLELDERRRQQHVALAARMLGEVIGELLAELVLVARELVAVGGRQVDRVLVRDVHARDRDAPVIVHLLDELSGQLDRLDVRPKGAPEHALEEGFQLRFDGAQNTHRGSRPV